MVEFETTVDRRHDVTFVGMTLTNRRRTTHRVTLRNALPGPAWLPRTRGVSPAWDGHTWQGTLEPGERRGVGFASPVAPTDPVVELVGAERETGPAEVDVATIVAERESARPSRMTGDRV